MGTILVSLTDNKDILWKNIKNKTRKNIGRLNNKIEISEINNKMDLNLFYELYLEMAERSRIGIYPLSFFIDLFEQFYSLNFVKIFLAKYNDVPVGADIVLTFNNCITLYFTVDSNFSRKNKIYVGDFLKWHIIKWGYENGYEYFDLNGVELYKIKKGNKKALSIYRFKSKWGGKLITFQDYEKIIYNNYIKRKQLLLNLSKLIGKRNLNLL